MGKFKFKKGDIVKVIDRTEDEFGKIGTIKEVDETDHILPYKVDDEIHSFGRTWYRENMLELVLEEQPTTKFKVGDQVVVKIDLKVGSTYNGGCRFTEGMKTWEGKTLTIKNDFKDGVQNRYYVEENGWTWTDDMLIPKLQKRGRKKKEIEEEVMETKNIEKELKNIVKELKERNSFDEVLKEEMKKRIQKISTDELIEDIHEDVNKFIKDNYGVLPRKIEVTNNEVKKELTGLFHNKFEEILKIVNKGVPLMLTGPAGAGKNHTLEQVAKSLDLDFYFSNAVTQEFKLTGFIDANGKYQETQFYKAFKDGGLFFLDEIDASCPDSLIILNSAIANGYFDFPSGRVNVNENFRCVCAGNTFGTGADMVYVGRNALDGATLDRFATIEFDYDEEVEKQLAYDTDLYEFIRALRKAIKDTGLRYIVSMRATINASKLLEIGLDKEEILKSVIIKNMSVDDLNIILGKLSFNNDWVRSLEWVRNARN